MESGGGKRARDISTNHGERKSVDEGAPHPENRKGRSAIAGYPYDKPEGRLYYFGTGRSITKIGGRKKVLEKGSQEELKNAGTTGKEKKNSKREIRPAEKKTQVVAI